MVFYFITNIFCQNLFLSESSNVTKNFLVVYFQYDLDLLIVYPDFGFRRWLCQSSVLFFGRLGHH